MLSKLTIKNVALIEYAEIEFGDGLNVLSGETGAGKSVILDSVNFVLGAKADRNMIRYGEAECFVKAEFFVSEQSKAIAELRELDIETDGEIIISRKFSDAGKNVIKINGNTVTAAMLRKVTDSLVDVHGQSEHFFLLKEGNQLKTLDAVIGEKLLNLKESLGQYLQEKKSIHERIALLGGDEKERGRRLDVLEFQIQEIEEVNLQEGEEEELLVKRNKINNLEKILSSVNEARNILSGDRGVLDGLRAANRSLNGIVKLDEEYESLVEKIEALSVEADDLVDALSSIGDDLYFDENEAEETERRLDSIRSLKRKYGNDKAEIDTYLEKIKAEFDILSDCEGQYAILMENLAKINKKIFACCLEITKLRKSEGDKFCSRVVEQLKTLNIAKAQFTIEFNDYCEEDIDRATYTGLDSICFLFSANAGEPMKPLGKIISGGEMSRFMLSLKTQLSDLNDISTYIFDEIDAGISGITAKVVGEKLAQIASKTQILAVSHLAQIAVMSDKQFLIEKQEANGKTLTYVHALNEDGRRKEIVRLLGGGDNDEYANKHAEELLKQAGEFKKTLSSY